MSFQDRFDVVLLNDNLEESFGKAESLYTAFSEGTLEMDERPMRV